MLGILITRARLTHLKVTKNMPYECMCLKSWDSNYAELLAATNLPSLQKRHIQLSLCHLYKIVNSLTDFPAAPVFPPDHFHKTRSSDKPTFIVPKFRTSAYQYSFFPNTLSLWNDLPKDILCIPL